MRVALILRRNADQVFGGDSQQMLQLQAALARLGVDAVVARLAEMPPAEEFDLLHMFSLEPSDYAQEMLAWARRGDLPVVLYPLFFANLRGWFERGIHRLPRWRRLHRLLGRGPTWAAFRAWHLLRNPFRREWRTCRELLHYVTLIAPNSAWEGRHIADHFRLAAAVRQRFRVSPVGIDADLYGPPVNPARTADFCSRHGIARPYVAEVARVEPNKNQLAVIQALYDEPLSLVFVGRPGPVAADYAAQCHALGRQRGRVHFLDWLPETDLPVVYAGAAAHLLPSWMELPGLASLEAAACDCRVVSTEISSVREYLGDDAWYCDPASQANIRAATLAALATPPPAGLRARLLKEFSRDAMARANLALYDEARRLHAAARG